MTVTERLDAYIAALHDLDPRWTGDLNFSGDGVPGRRSHDSERIGRLLGEFVPDPVAELVELWRW